MKQIRQGDVYLRKTDDGINGKVIKPINGMNVLAEGEATGHHHTMTAETSTLFEVNGKMAIVVNKPTVLAHQEHQAIEVHPGTYWVVRQREYTPKEIVRVRD